MTASNSAHGEAAFKKLCYTKTIENVHKIVDDQVWVWIARAKFTFVARAYIVTSYFVAVRFCGRGISGPFSLEIRNKIIFCVLFLNQGANKKWKCDRDVSRFHWTDNSWMFWELKFAVLWKAQRRILKSKEQTNKLLQYDGIHCAQKLQNFKNVLQQSLPSNFLDHRLSFCDKQKNWMDYIKNIF